MSSIIFEMEKERKFFLTFGGGGPKFNYHIGRICDEATRLNVFDKIIGLNELSLKNDREFYSRHGRFIQHNISKGYGRYIWKAHIVKKVMDALMEDNDILVYADCGCTLNPDGKQRLEEYFQMVRSHESGMLGIALEDQNGGSVLAEKRFTKEDVFQYFNVDSSDQSIRDTSQLISGAIVIRKCPISEEAVDEWERASKVYNLLDDSPSQIQNDPSFDSHRHDQSVFSVIRKKYGCAKTWDETMTFTRGGRLGDKPILATRLTHYRQWPYKLV